ncbi:DUF2796 domain-containing protein [Rhodobacteraceae bacterium KMM 6894]|nr:DUF2796 domain-containing protein [Rhodobacteraceae bacterium KMM 6894]
MKILTLALLASVAATPILAEETREMGAHVHGVSKLELAIEGGIVEMNLTSPGMDIVGFEYAASTDADKDAVKDAIRTLLVSENIVTFPAAAKCRPTGVLAHLGDDAHGEDDHEEHDDHADADDHEHQEGGEHTEFNMRYIFACEHPEALTAIAFPFFERFEHAQEIEAQFVTETGAGAAEIGRDAAVLTLN